MYTMVAEQVCKYVSKFSNDMFVCNKVWKKFMYIVLTLMANIYFHVNGSKYEKGETDIMNINQMVVMKYIDGLYIHPQFSLMLLDLVRWYTRRGTFQYLFMYS